MANAKPPEFRSFLFSEIPVGLLYSALKLRSDVFVVEQQCIYPDLDNKDILPHSMHVILQSETALNSPVIAYARCLPPGVSYKGSSIGRVAIAQQHRNKGLARLLMLSAIDICQQHWPESPIQIGAQTYLQSFYQSLGFDATSEPYDEDGIMHIDMQFGT